MEIKAFQIALDSLKENNIESIEQMLRLGLSYPFIDHNC